MSPRSVIWMLKSFGIWFLCNFSHGCGRLKDRIHFSHSCGSQTFRRYHIWSLKIQTTVCWVTFIKVKLCPTRHKVQQSHFYRWKEQFSLHSGIGHGIPTLSRRYSHLITNFKAAFCPTLLNSVTYSCKKAVISRWWVEDLGKKEVSEEIDGSKWEKSSLWILSVYIYIHVCRFLCWKGCPRSIHSPNR